MDSEKDVLDAAWRRWQRGEITERSPAPAYGDALRLERERRAHKLKAKEVSEDESLAL